jgi:hypothetical protein
MLRIVTRSMDAKPGGRQQAGRNTRIAVISVALATEGQMLRAGHGADVLFHLRLGRNGRRLPVTVSIE